MNILIVHDHAIVRRGLRELLSDEFPAATITDVSTVEEALRELSSDSRALVILGVSGRGGADALPVIHTSYPETPVLVLGAHAEEHEAIRALRAGAVGYLTEDCTAEELAAASRKAGETLTHKPSQRPRHENLSDRELQVLRMLATGTSVKQIGVELLLSDKTISTYRARVLVKMAMTSNVELVRYAVQMRLVQ